MTTETEAGPVPSTDWTVLYDAEVIAVGPMVTEFVSAGVLVLFGEQAPQELHEFAVLHRTAVHVEGPAPGDTVELGSTRLTVLAVGDVVAANFRELGHFSFKADGRTEAAMPGDVCVPVGSLTEPAVGDRIRVVRLADGGAR